MTASGVNINKVTFRHIIFVMPKIRKDKKKPGAVPIKQGENNIKLNLFSSAGSVLKSDGTLSRPRIYKPLYGPSQGDETAD